MDGRMVVKTGVQLVPARGAGPAHAQARLLGADSQTPDIPLWRSDPQKTEVGLDSDWIGGGGVGSEVFPGKVKESLRIEEKESR